MLEEAKKSFWKNTPTLILSVQETDISSLKKKLKLLSEINNSGADIRSMLRARLSRNSGLKETEMHLKYALRWALAEVLTYLPEKLNAHLKYSVKQVWNGFTDFAKNLAYRRMMELPKFAATVICER